MAITRWIVSILVSVSILAHPTSLWSCGPFFARAAFTYTVHPDFPLEAFAASALGVLQPTYARAYLAYLAVAYGYLTGLHFTAAEQQAVVALWRTRLVSGMGEGSEAAENVWLEARRTVPGAVPLMQLDVFRRLGQFQSYRNCTTDAFRTAVKTLQRVQARFGPESPAVRAWLQAQDVVFSTCADGAGRTIPAPAEPQLQAEHAYQSAAAHFYSGAFDNAAEAFDAIAQDAASPWRELAPYLAARALVRQAMLGPAPGKVDTAVLERAAMRVRAILRQAYQVLHKQYPQSPWSKQTKHWF